MDLTELNLSMSKVMFTLVAAIFVSELVGYGLHRLLHSDRFPALSRAHLIHHFDLYGPNGPMRATEYKNATEGRASIGNIGWEWLIPSAMVLASSWGVMQIVGVPHCYEYMALSLMLAWPIFMFSYIHDRMHLTNCWMERVPLVRNWFVGARRLHDIHHRSMNDEGRMDRNFGIGFFLFDRIFGTLTKRHARVNWRGYRAAMRRYKLDHTENDDLSDFPSSYRVKDPT